MVYFLITNSQLPLTFLNSQNVFIVKTVGDEDFSEFNPKELQIYVAEIVAATGATKAISSCVYHGGAQEQLIQYCFL